MASRTPTLLPRLARRLFSSTAPQRVRPGDRIPDLRVLHEASPGNAVSLARELQGKTAVVVGVPAAFSPACSAEHVPGYMKHARVAEVLKGGGGVFVVGVNDAFVMKAWQEQLDPKKESGIRFLADPTGQFTSALDLGFDGSAIFGGMRGKRYALKVEDGVVKEAFVEPDNTGLNVSAAEKVLG